MKFLLKNILRNKKKPLENDWDSLASIKAIKKMKICFCQDERIPISIDFGADNREQSNDSLKWCITSKSKVPISSFIMQNNNILKIRKLLFELISIIFSPLKKKKKIISNVICRNYQRYHKYIVKFFKLIN